MIQTTVAQNKTLTQALLEYLKSAEGLMHFGQVAERGPMLANAILQNCNYSESAALASCTARSFASWSWLTRAPHAIAMTPDVIQEVKEACDAWNDPSLTAQQKRYRIEKGTRALTDGAANYAYTLANIASLFPRLNKVCAFSLAVGEAADLVHDTVNLKMNCENYFRATSLDLSQATPQMRDAVNQTKTNNLWAIAKEIGSVTTGIFAMLFLVTGAAMLSEIVLATLLLASTLFSSIRKLHEETMSYKPIQFLEQPQVKFLYA